MKRININRIKLTPYERRIEEAVERGEYKPVSKAEFEEIKQALERRKKNAVLNLRINQGDLDLLKSKAAKLGVKYQTLISEILHRVAMS